jgi:hypothetical protein
MTLITIADSATRIPALVIDLGRVDDPGGVLERAGYDTAGRYVLLVRLDPVRAEIDWARWDEPTMREAHLLLEAGAYERLRPGDVLDVREARERRAG